MIAARTIGQIGTSGRARPAARRPLPPQAFVLPDPIARAVEMIQDGQPMAEIARQLNMASVRALRWHLARYGVRVRDVRRAPAARVFSLERLAALFSSTPTRIRRWIRMGALVATRNETEKRRSPRQRMVLITEQAVLDFLAVREQWPSWEPASITDSDLRMEAERLREEAGGHWVQLAAWARAHGYTPNAASQWVAAGLIPAIPYGRVLYVWSTDLIDWRPPPKWSVAWRAAGRPRGIHRSA